MEYTAFFVVIIYIFDQLIVSGLIRFLLTFFRRLVELITLEIFYLKGNIMDSFEKGDGLFYKLILVENKVKENLYYNVHKPTICWIIFYA